MDVLRLPYDLYDLCIFYQKHFCTPSDLRLSPQRRIESQRLCCDNRARHQISHIKISNFEKKDISNSHILLDKNSQPFIWTKCIPCILAHPQRRNCCKLFEMDSKRYGGAWWRHQMEKLPALLAICSPHKGQWRGALMFSLVCAWINGWVNNREPGDLRRHHTHYASLSCGWFKFATCLRSML